MRVREAEAGDLPAVLELLRASGLPLGGVPDDLTLLLIAEQSGRVVGAAGLELRERDGLLRSVATASDFRGRRVASTLCDEIERRAASHGARCLHLLTETAEGFFGKRGWRRVARSDAPPGIAHSPEFTSLCPASAVLMRKPPVLLDGAAPPVND